MATVAVQEAQQDDAARERQAVFARCERFLNGHAPQRPREELVELAREAGEDEEPDLYGEGALIEDFEKGIATTLGKTAIPGVSVVPDPPQTRMMHVYLRGDPDRLLAASADIAREERVLLFRRLRLTGVPGVCIFELSVGDAAASLTDEEISAYFTRVMAG